MTIVSEPLTTVNIVNAVSQVSNTAHKVLFVGQQTSAGTAVSGALTENILDDQAEDTLYGIDSALAAMIRAARAINPIVRFDAIGLDDDGSGVAATGTFGVTGTATEDGVLIINVGSEKNHRFSVAVTSGDSATEVGDAIEAALTADTKIPGTALNATGTVTITAVNKGTYGNFGLSVEGTVAGIVVAVTAMASGATDPSLTGVFDVVGENRYQGVVWQYTDVTELVAFLDPRFNVDNAVLDGCGFVSVTDSLANHLSRLGALNSENIVEIVDKAETSSTTYKGPAQLEIASVKASQFASLRALRLTQDASISSIVLSANGPLDSFGGPALASKPYFNTPFANLPLVGTGRGWTPVEIGQLKDAGGAVIGNNTSGTESIIGQVPTTYKTDSAGNPDLTFKFLNFRDTASESREYFFNNLKARFAQSRLTEGSVVRGRDQANDLLIAAFIERLYQDLAGPDFVLVQDGDDAIKFFKDNLVVTLDLALGKATVQMITPIVTQLRTILVTQKISFSAEA